MAFPHDCNSLWNEFKLRRPTIPPQWNAVTQKALEIVTCQREFLTKLKTKMSLDKTDLKPIHVFSCRPG